jgi:hypothetical protein
MTISVAGEEWAFVVISEGRRSDPLQLQPALGIECVTLRLSLARDLTQTIYREPEISDVRVVPAQLLR